MRRRARGRAACPGADANRAQERADRGAQEATGPHARLQRAGRRDEALGRAAL